MIYSYIIIYNIIISNNYNITAVNLVWVLSPSSGHHLPTENINAVAKWNTYLILVETHNRLTFSFDSIQLLNLVLQQIIIPSHFKIETKIITKHFFKNERVCRDTKTKKAQEQDWDGNIATKLN